MARFHPLVTTAPAVALMGLSASLAPVQAQDAADLMAEARAVYEDRMAGIESYELTTTMSGMEMTTRHVRREIDGVVLFVPEDLSDEQGAGGQTEIDPAFFYRPDVAERMRIEGTETVEGTSCRVVVLDDFEGLQMERAMGAAATNFRPRLMRLCLDTDEYLLRKVEMEGVLTGMGEPQEISSTMVMTDYREVDGMMHPFRMEITTSGMGMGGDQGQATAALEQLRKQLESLPESQRQAMEEMLGEQMESMGALAGAASGSLVIETTALEVNRGG